MSSTHTQEPNYIREAFLLPWNLLALAAAGLWTFFNPEWFELTWTLVAGLELLYLGLLPRSRRFQRWVRSRQGHRQKPASETEMLLSLDRARQGRFVAMRGLLDAIEARYGQYSSPSRALLEGHERRLQQLLQAYLRLLLADQQYATYLATHSEAEIRRALAELEQDVQDDPPRIQRLKARRIEVLRKRLERYQQVREQAEAVRAQLETIEDVFRFIHEQALTMKDPEALRLELDNLLQEVEETEQAVQEMEALFEPLARLSVASEETEVTLRPRRSRSRST